MNESEIKALIGKGEGLRVEFKQCKTALSKEVYETVCAFLNRLGGELLITPQATQQVTPQAAQQDEERIKIILEFCKTPKDREEIQKLLGLKDREYFRSEVLKPLLEQGLLHPTIPDKLTSPKQKYYSVKRGDVKK